METKPEHYTEHEGTVRVSGKTTPKSAACCAFAYVQKGVEPIDFFYIGANAGHQAMKAMTTFAHMVSQELQLKGTVAFIPIRVMARTTDPITNLSADKDATVWRAVMVKE